MSNTLDRLRSPATILALLSPLLVAGCESPFLKPPSVQAPTDTSNPCVANCTLMKTQCEQRQLQREQECQGHVARLAAERENCPTHGSQHCAPPIDCLGPDMSICATQYGDCVADCGQPVAPPAKRPAAPPETAPKPVVAQ